MTYWDDLAAEKYEIWTSEADGKQYLVFLASVIKTSLAFDEAQMYDPVKVALELHSDSIHRFSRQGNVFFSAFCTLVVLGGFLAILYAFILPKNIRNRFFGLDETPKDFTV